MKIKKYRPSWAVNSLKKNNAHGFSPHLVGGFLAATIFNLNTQMVGDLQRFQKC